VRESGLSVNLEWEIGYRKVIREALEETKRRNDKWAERDRKHFEKRLRRCQP